MKNTHKPKVIFINTGQNIDGAVKTTPFVQSQAASLASHFDIQWYLLNDNTSFSRIRTAIRELRKWVKADKNIALIHAHYGSMTSFIATSAAGSIPLVVSYGGDDLLGTVQPGLKWRIREKLARQMSLYSAKRASAIIVKSKNLLEALPKNAQAKATIIPNGVNTMLFKPLNQQEARAQLNLASSKKYILFNGSKGNNTLVKNRPLAEATTKIVQEQYPETELLVVGRLSQRDLILHMQASDLLLLTSLHEGSPNIVKEAMACNLPIVSVPCGDVNERLVQVNKGGVATYNANDLASLCCQALKLKHEYNGRTELLRQGLDHQIIAQRIAQIYAGLKISLEDTSLKFNPNDF